MVFKRLVIILAVFTIFVGGAFTAYQVADTGQNDAAQVNKTQTNQSVVVEYDSYQFVNTDEFTAGFGNNTTAYYNGNELTRGTDYFWNQTDGTILYNNTAATDEGNISNLTYDYYQNTQEVQTLSSPLGTIVTAIGNLSFFAGGIGLALVLIFVGGFIASRLTGNNVPGTNR